MTDIITRVICGLLPAFAMEGKPVQWTLQERMAYWKVPGVSIAVIQNGEIAWAKGFGVLKAGGSSPVTADTQFQAGSISKPIAALGALKLVDQGRLALDDDVNGLLRSWKVPENGLCQTQKVTLRRLLSHSAGITVHGFNGYGAGQALPSLLQVLNGEDPANSGKIEVNAEPGAAATYSGGGYTVMQQLLIDLTEGPFPQSIGRSVLEPLGMAHSGYEPLSGNAASGHHNDGQAVAGDWHRYPELAAAGLWTTASDLGRFAIEIQRSNGGRSNKVLSQAMAHQMLTLQKGEFGLGVFLSDKGGKLAFSHGGVNEGFQSMLFAYAEGGQGAVVMCNGDSGLKLADEILRSISKEYGWPDYKQVSIPAIQVQALSPAELGSYAGLYQKNGQAGQYVLLDAKEGKLSVQLPGWDYEMAPVGKGRFNGLDGYWNYEARFRFDSGGAVEGFQDYWDRGQKPGDDYQRVQDSPAPLHDYEGSYRHPKSGKTDTITVHDGQAWYNPSAFNVGELPMKKVGTDEFFCHFAILSFRRDAHGRVTDFDFDFRPGQGAPKERFKKDLK